MDSDDDVQEVEKLNQFIENLKREDIQDELFGIGDSDLEDELEDVDGDDNTAADDDDDDRLSVQIENDLKKLEGVFVKVPDETEQVYLTNEENATVNRCTDPEIKKVLLLNRMKSNQLKAAYKTVYALYTQCCKVVENGHQLLNEKYLSTTSPRKYQTSHKLGAPYFKTTSLHFCPPNLDVQRKRNAEERPLLSFNRKNRWTFVDQTILKRSVCFNYTELYRIQQTTRIKELRNATENPFAKIDLRDAVRNLKEISVSSKLVVPPLNCDLDLQWDEISQIQLRRRHSGMECRSFWNIFLHPDINTSNWSEEENEKIKSLARKYKYENWDLIAKELDTNRTAFIICMHYFANISDPYVHDRFSKEEDNQLLIAVECNRIGSYIPWGKVCTYFTNRSKRQLYHRYKYYLSNNLKLGAFSNAEDVLLLCLINRFGKNFSTCAQYMKNRSSIQLRNRYSCYLQKPMLTGTFTPEEDQTILEFVERNGTNNYALLAETLGRNRAHVRHRYIKISNWLKDNDDLTNLPRNGSARRYHDIEKIMAHADKFKNCKEIPTLKKITEECGFDDEEIVQKRPQTYFGKAIDVDKELLEFFVTTCRSNKGRKNVPDKTLSNTAQDIAEVLRILGANLDIPNDEELEAHAQLDQNDCTILKHLREQGNCLSSPSTSAPATVSNTLIPTFSSIIGLRGLILQYNIYNSRIPNDKSIYDSKMLFRLERNLLSLDETQREKVKQERELFKKRMYALLKWPSILSLMQPPKSLIEGMPAKTPPIPRKRKVGRPSRSEKYKKCFDMLSKRMKKNQEPSTSKTDESEEPIETIAKEMVTDDDELKEVRLLDDAIQEYTAEDENQSEDEINIDNPSAVWRQVEEDLLMLV